MKRSILPIAIAVVLLISAGSYSGEKAPDFTLPDLEGNSVSLSDYEGKVVLLNFWATWCPPCRHEIPYFNELYKEYRDEGFEVLGISLDRGGEKTVEKFLESNEVIYPILMGDNSVTTIYQEFVPPDQRNSIPFTFIIDGEGNISKVYVGSRPKDVFEKHIREVLIP